MSNYTRINPATATKTSGLFTPASGITVESQSFTSYGKIAFLDIYVKHASAWNVGSQYNIGTVADGYRPAQNSFGVLGSFGVTVILPSGDAYVRPLASVGENAANASAYARFVYILP